MHLSISSSNDRLPIGHWAKVWVSSIIVCVLFIGYFEIRLRNLGWSPSVVDSKELWSQQRQKASLLGDKAIILVGSSRMQLDIDLGILKDMSNLYPVQLAIDGSPIIQVLENLANDENIKGTIIISVTMPKMMGNPKSRASEWVDYYQRGIKEEAVYEIINKKIVSLLDGKMVTRLEGAKPEKVIFNLAFKEKSLGNYLVTQSNRSRNADYQKVPMPLFYAKRLERHYGEKLKTKPNSFQAYFQKYEDKIKLTRPSLDNIPKFMRGVALVKKLVNKIEARGGDVFLVRFPTDKLLWEFDRRSYPKEIYWKVVKENFKNTIYFDDFPTLKQFDLPDGSHLDYRDKQKFTKALFDLII